MSEFYSIHIEKDSPIPLYQQLGDALCDLIEKGVLAPNTKLPPIRQMAGKLKINNVTVVAAYKYLENKKAVYSQVGSGTYVSPIPMNQIPEPVVEENFGLAEQRKKLYEIKTAINFVNTSLPEELFPVTEFKAAFDLLLDLEKGKAFSYQESQGYLPLREFLCSQLLPVYGIKAMAENIQIISGAQQGIDLISKAMVNYGDVIFVERPTFYGAAGAFLSRGGRIIEIPIEPDGMDVDTLENLMKLYRPKFLYLMSYFQTPTGISYSMEKKRKIIELAEKYDAYIVEDDNLYDFNYTGKHLAPMKALDYHNRVIYIKSFSKIMMPGLRIGLIVLPKKLMNSVRNAKFTTDISTSGLIQKAFYFYLKNNSWQEHTETLRQYSMGKYKRMIKVCDRFLKDKMEYHKPQGGISLWLRLKPDLSIDCLMNELLKKGVIVSPGSQFLISGEKSRHIRVCFAHVTDDQIEVGIRRIKECIGRMEQ